MGMLALTRRKGEEVVLGDPLNPLGFVRVVEIHGDKVKLAFSFPPEMPINRRELADEKKAEAEAARRDADRNAPPAEHDDDTAA